MNAGARLFLPEHPSRRFGTAGVCIYCGARERLTDEHVVPFSAGGRWIVPQASCKQCAAITGAFEGEFARTILGPLRMLYNLPTRRPKERPKYLPLKVKYPRSTDWEVAYVDRGICPFLVALPLYPLPNEITGEPPVGDQGPAISRAWIRGGGFHRDRDAHLQWLCDALGATEVMPMATLNTEPFCLTLAKVAHSFAVGELGVNGFDPFLANMIRERNLSNRAQFIGGGEGNEAVSKQLHDITLDRETAADRGVIIVQVRILGCLGTPTYSIAVGRAR